MENATDRSIAITRVLPAGIEKVWRVWSQPEEIAQWWGPDGFTNTIRKMDFTEGGEWLLSMHGPDGKNYPNKSVFKEIVPHQKIVMQHFNPHYLATIVFEPKGHETKIEWSMEFETPELFDTVVKVFKADEGLKQNGEKLERYLRDHV